MKPLPLWSPLLGLALVLSASGADTANLVTKLPYGKQLAFEISVDGDMEIAGGPGGSIAQKTEMTMRYTVLFLKPRPEGGAELDLVFGDQEMRMTQNGTRVVNIDTAGESIVPPGIGLDVFEQLKGTRMKARLNKEYKVEKMSGIEEFLKKLASAEGPVAGAVAGSFNEETFKNMGNFSSGIPQREVKSGESWTETQDMGTMRMSSTNTFKSWSTRNKRKVAVLAVEGTLSGQPPAPGGEVRVDLLSGSIQGEQFYDPELGVITDGDLRMKMKMRIEGPFPGELIVPVDQTVRFKLTGAKPI